MVRAVAHRAVRLNHVGPGGGSAAADGLAPLPEKRILGARAVEDEVSGKSYRKRAQALVALTAKQRGRQQNCLLAPVVRDFRCGRARGACNFVAESGKKEILANPIAACAAWPCFLRD